MAVYSQFLFYDLDEIKTKVGHLTCNYHVRTPDKLLCKIKQQQKRNNSLPTFSFIGNKGLNCCHPGSFMVGPLYLSFSLPLMSKSLLCHHHHQHHVHLVVFWASVVNNLCKGVLLQTVKGSAVAQW